MRIGAAQKSDGDCSLTADDDVLTGGGGIVKYETRTLTCVDLWRPLCAGACFLLFFPMDSVFAQNTASAANTMQIEEVVVTAQRRSENLQDVPIAVTALDEKALKDAGIRSVAELPQLVPGFTFNTQSGGWGQPRIRGVGIAASAPGVENSVATYFDGVYYAAAASSLFDLHDVAQVAVLKGPQGTLFGRNATGGLVQVTTKDPSQHFATDLEGTIGNKETKGLNSYVTGPLTDQLAGSLALNVDDQDAGFGKNIPTGQDVQTHRAYAARGKLLFQQDATKFTLSADYTHRKSTDFAMHVLGLEPFTGRPVPGGPWDTDLNVLPISETTAYGITLNGQHDFDGMRLASTTGYRHSCFAATYDGDQSPADSGRRYFSVRDSQFSQELQLLSTGDRKLSWQLGLYYLWWNGGYDPFNSVNINLLTNAVSSTSELSDDTLDSYSAYGQATYALNASTNLTAGLRYTLDQRTHDNSIRNQITDAVTVGAAGSARFTKPTWRLALDHHLSQDVLSYVSYNRGFKSGTFDPADTHAIIIKPESLDAYEAGIKSEFLDKRIRLNPELYYYNYTNYQNTQFVNGLQRIYSADAKMYGMDLDLTAAVTQDFTLNAGVSWIHARYGSFPGAYRTIPNPGLPCVGTLNTANCGGNAFGFGTIPGTFGPNVGIDATGHKLQRTPDYTYNIGADYRFPSSSGDFTLSANYFYNAGYFTEPENRLREPSYGVWNTSLTWVSPDGKFDVSMWVKNLANEVYSYQINAITVGDARIAAPGRTFGVTAGVHF
jgi:iron complex outermembrane recepter protein